MAIIGIMCEFCGKTFTIEVVDTKLEDLTEELVDQCVELFSERHGRKHSVELLDEIEEVLANGNPGDSELRP